MSKVILGYATSPEWTQTVLADFDRFLLDHAAAEKKAAGMAISMLSHYPDRTELVEEMAELAVEEMIHYRQVVKIIHSRGLITCKDEKDPYVNDLRSAMRKQSDDYFLDRLLVGSIIEARGAERFGLITEALEPGKLKNFYRTITQSEESHLGLMADLAKLYFADDAVDARMQELLAIESDIVAKLPLRAALH